MSRVLTIIVGLIVLAIAVEAGYFWGLKRSASLTIPRIDITQKSPTGVIPILSSFPTPFPAAAIPGLLSHRAAVEVSQNSVEPQVWLSDWIIGQGGNLVVLTENSITLDYFDSGRRDFVFPAGIGIEYFKWSRSARQSLPVTPTEFNPGDNVSIRFTIDTTSGSFKRVEITKNVD